MLVNLNKFVLIYVDDHKSFVTVWGKMPESYADILIDKFESLDKAKEFLEELQNSLERSGECVEISRTPINQPSQSR
jgi:hypothetical protein